MREPKSWIIIQISNGLVFGAQFVKPPSNSFDPAIFEIKPWFSGFAPNIGDSDPTINNLEWQENFDAWNEGILAISNAKQWYQDNSNASLLFTLSIADLDDAIENRTDNQETLLLKTLAMAIRILAKREKLI